MTASKADEVGAALREVEQAVSMHNLHAAGFLSYEAAPAFDSALRVLPTQDFPLTWFGLYPEPSVISLPAPENPAAVLNWRPTVEQGEYNAAIENIKRSIERGLTYQVNYTMRLRADFPGDTWDFFLNLAQTQNKYAAYADAGRYVICSASPELFFELDGENILSRPMKGTVRRGRNNAEDTEQAKWLRDSIKNRAENVMIVDMIRNDLGRIAQIGSVHVPELFSIEKYSTLLQMTSTVRAKTRAPLAEIFGALFPCPSITGAPKVSTMNLIAGFESTPRRIYTGSIGFIAPGRKAQFNVAIRTVLIDRHKRQAEYGVGGGIVWDSDSTDEYNEALLKTRILTEHRGEFSLLETILWTPQEGYFLGENHIRRMSNSADYFGFPFSKEELENHLDEMALKFTSPQRVRVLLNRSGKLSGEAKDILQNNKKTLKVRLAAKPVNSGNVFLFHKTTRREIYEEAFKSYNGYDDILFFNEKNELTEFTIGNLVAALNGELVTPPVECGLLAGTFREHLLHTGEIKEQVVKIEDLKGCQKIFLVNSIRKWAEIKLENPAQ
ncbi:MAG: aminodeoxychorismate synthase component I [Chloroflexi bacterium]|nr:aminodeoxychorismate synthase component I [Chloroflexota bacterium]